MERMKSIHYFSFYSEDHDSETVEHFAHVVSHRVMMPLWSILYVLSHVTSLLIIELITW